MKKKLLSILLCVAMCSVLFAGCSSSSSSSGSSDSSGSGSSVSQSDLNDLAAAALYRELDSNSMVYDDVAPGQCTYDIATTTGNSSSGWTVKGQVWFHDEYGDLIKGYIGDYSCNFEVEISSDLSTDCTLISK